MDEGFLLTTALSERLYYDYAKALPIIDFHNHLCVSDLANDVSFKNISEVWVTKDPYKHRAMRILGVEERFITGSATDLEKFYKWCEVFPLLVGNPLWHWSETELKRVFNTDLLPNKENAEKLYSITGERLKSPALSARGFLKLFNVEYAAPCCLITDSVEEFNGIDGVSPSMRGDNILPLTKDFVSLLSEKSGERIKDLSSFSAAVKTRLTDFSRAGCKFCDHALDNGFVYLPDDGKNEKRFSEILSGEALNREDAAYLNSHILRILAAQYSHFGWVMQLHIGAMRHTSSRLRAMLGPAGGYAAIGTCAVDSTVEFLNDLEKAQSLPQTILFTLNPSDNERLAVLSGSFVQDGVSGKVTQGAAWWWCDHLGGIRGVLSAACEYSVLAAFLGMTTDSRSLLSFSRHEYFRRVLCGFLGEKAQRGEITSDVKILGDIVERLCYKNIKNILGDNI